MPEKNKTCFIIMPITTPESFREKYRDGEDHFKHVLQCLFSPSVKAAGYEPIPPTAKGSDLIHAEIIRNLETADLVLCDMSCLNPNVFFEFGIRTSLNKPVCVVKDELTKKIPFDTGILNHQEYKSSINPWDLVEEIKKLAEHIRAAVERSKGDNTLWRYFGLRSSAQPYEGESGTDAKLDYLSMQLDSLQEKVGAMEHISYPRQYTELEEKIEQLISSYLPRHVEIVSYSPISEGSMKVRYYGTIPKSQLDDLKRIVSDIFNIDLIFIKVELKQQVL